MANTLTHRPLGTAKGSGFYDRIKKEAPGSARQDGESAEANQASAAAIAQTDLPGDAASPSARSTEHRVLTDERRLAGVPNRSVLVPSDWRWKLMQWMVPAIALWCVADVYLGSNGIKVTITSLVGLLLMGGWLAANFIREKSPEEALRVADGSLFLAAAVLVGQLCFAATKPDPVLLRLAIQDLIIWAPLASGLSAFAYARKSWVPVAVTAGTYAALSVGVIFYGGDQPGAISLPFHGLFVQALGILTMGVFFNRLRDTVSLTIARLRIAEEQSHVDTLTGLLNRRKFDLDWAKTCEQQPGACLLLIDIDHFKRINDDFGHAAGDRVLTTVGHALARAIEGKGRAYRWGGEEFALIVNGGRLHGRMLAEKLLPEVASLKQETGRPITLSAGLSVAKREHTAAMIFQQADEALFEAKKTGRNRLVCAESSPGQNSKLPGPAQAIESFTSGGLSRPGDVVR